jgi:hypothetical protein
MFSHLEVGAIIFVIAHHKAGLMLVWVGQVSVWEVEVDIILGRVS